MKYLKWLLTAPFAALVLFNVYAYGTIISYRALAPHRTSFMTMRMDEFAESRPDTKLNYQWVAYDKISVNLKKALIASEDANFAEHGGFDWNGIKSAIQRNERGGKIKAGGSTISQQLAKEFVFKRKPQLFSQSRRSRTHVHAGSNYRQRPHLRALSQCD